MHTTTTSPEIVTEHAVFPVMDVGADVDPETTAVAVAIAEAVTVVPVAVEIAEDNEAASQLPEHPLEYAELPEDPEIVRTNVTVEARLLAVADESIETPSLYEHGAVHALTATT